MSNIEIIHANEGTLKNLSITIPKNKLVVFTGLSGSGKSTLLMDVLFDECQRQYLEALSMQGIKKPNVERIRGASPAIFISQIDASNNPRSTVGTMSDIYTNLRMIYEKLGVSPCLHCQEQISSADCKEETEKIDNDFYVYRYCSHCGKRMKKITRTHFSFNTKEGACPTCEGLGKVHSIRKELVVEESLSLESGAVRYFETQYKTYQISIFHAALRHYGLPIPKDLLISQFSDLQKALLYDGVESELLKQELPHCQPPKTSSAGKFEGVIPILWRRFIEKEGNAKHLEEYFSITECPTCNGERLSLQSRMVTIQGMRLPNLSHYSLEQLWAWNETLYDSLSKEHLALVSDYLLDTKTKLERFMKLGVGYLSLDRQMITLSGGELQRLRLAAVLDSDLSGVIYILDEPTVGLHPKDTAGLIAVLQKLRDLGNSVLVIEHDPDVMEAADYMIELGPGAGKHGGNILAVGTLQEIQQTKGSVTGLFLKTPPPLKTVFRKPTGSITIEHASKFNLKDISVTIPTGCLTTITGPSGSGKSTLIFEVLGKQDSGSKDNRVLGTEQFDDVIMIEQSPITKMKRSNVATYSDLYILIRDVFAKLEHSIQSGLNAKHFSFNVSGGRCDHCEGLGYIDSNMLFFSNTQIVCPTCNGNQFKKEVLAIKYQTLSIKDVLMLSVEEAIIFFANHPKILRILKLLEEVGLGYLELGQTLTALSGGEGQRLKLAKELLNSNSSKKNLYLMDEPTTGLHPKDIEQFLVLLNKMVDAGNSIIVVEHNQQLLLQSDWQIDLGPAGGEKGGEVIYTGPPRNFFTN